MTNLEKLISIMLVLAALFMGAITHELDIVNSCTEKGTSGKSAWTVVLKCSVIE